MPSPQKPAEIPLAMCAKRLGLSWHATWRLLLIGKLSGRQVGGRWLIDCDSVEKLAAERQSDETTKRARVPA